ncbi:hypothetical protein ACQ33O_04305 [Ferruginibacter sp. SUN002]|uniref:hypothetical protein n=1 Tax=Ferruginibacter sp. SUN002 TaxID=2937789 RepID=UPI003D3604E6
MIQEKMLPASILQSKVLSQSHLKQLCDIEEIPAVSATFSNDKLKQIIQYYSINPADMEYELHQYAKELLDRGKVDEAWQVLLTIT